MPESERIARRENWERDRALRAAAPGSDLNLDMNELRGEIGARLGWGRGKALGHEQWTAQKEVEITRLLNTALRWVYHEASVQPNMPPHQWSWLTPAKSFTIASGSRTCNLPDDFGGFSVNRLTVTQGDTGGVYSNVPLIGEPYIDEKYAAVNTATGRPVVAAERKRQGPNHTHSDLFELYVYPEPDAEYTFRGPYNLLGKALTASWPFAYGGTAMASCFQAACRAVSEIHLDNLRPGEGPEWMVFQRSLSIAIARDSRHQPKTLGLNTDGSDPSHRMGSAGNWWGDGFIAFVDPVTVEGTLPDSY